MPEEIFSSSLVEGILGSDQDEDLELYLEEQIYPSVSKSKKVTLDRISSSLYLLSFEEGGQKKNIVIQKFYDPEKDEYVFEKNETDSDAMKIFLK